MRAATLLVLGVMACKTPQTDHSLPFSDPTTGTPSTGAVSVSMGSWRLHANVGSMVYVSWEQTAAAPARVEYTFDDEDVRSTPRFDADAGSHEQILLGIPFDTEVHWRVVLEVDGGQTVMDGPSATTAPLPERLPLGTVTVSQPDAWEPTGNYLYTSISQRTGSWPSGYYWTFIESERLMGRSTWIEDLYALVPPPQ